jgi:FixJ family two-component response regulator
MAKRDAIVYIIDDDESVRRAFGRLLTSASVRTQTFASPEEFLSAARQERNACIVADIRMPGLTGFDLTEKLRTLGIRIPVIIVSASDEAQIREYARDLGAVAFFQKPVDDQALLDAIWWAISSNATAQ